MEPEEENKGCLIKHFTARFGSSCSSCSVGRQARNAQPPLSEPAAWGRGPGAPGPGGHILPGCGSQSVSVLLSVTCPWVVCPGGQPSARGKDVSAGLSSDRHLEGTVCEVLSKSSAHTPRPQGCSLHQGLRLCSRGRVRNVRAFVNKLATCSTAQWSEEEEAVAAVLGCFQVGAVCAPARPPAEAHPGVLQVSGQNKLWPCAAPSPPTWCQGLCGACRAQRSSLGCWGMWPRERCPCGRSLMVARR